MRLKIIFLLPSLLIAILIGGCTSLSLQDAAMDGDVETVRHLIEQGADVNALGNSSGNFLSTGAGTTPLIRAIGNSRNAVAELLIAKGADVNGKDGYGETPLHSAAGRGSMAIAKLLIEKGANVNAKDNDGQTPLFWAAGSGKSDLIKLLIDNAADPGIADHEGILPTTIAQKNNHIDVVAILAKAEKEGPKRVEAAADDPQEKANFEKAAQDYLNAATKPALPEDARKFKVQAESAIRDKDFEGAAQLYGKALDIAPWWPEGHFNRALVLGENRYYLGAIREMKRYLTLVPDAPDARAAQDKIYDWERKAGK